MSSREDTCQETAWAHCIGPALQHPQESGSRGGTKEMPDSACLLESLQEKHLIAHIHGNSTAAFSRLCVGKMEVNPALSCIRKEPSGMWDRSSRGPCSLGIGRVRQARKVQRDRPDALLSSPNPITRLWVGNSQGLRGLFGIFSSIQKCSNISFFPCLTRTPSSASNLKLLRKR